MLAKLNGKIFGSRIKINGQIPSKQQWQWKIHPHSRIRRDFHRHPIQAEVVLKLANYSGKPAGESAVFNTPKTISIQIQGYNMLKLWCDLSPVSTWEKIIRNVSFWLFWNHIPAPKTIGKSPMFTWNPRTSRAPECSKNIQTCVLNIVLVTILEHLHLGDDRGIGEVLVMEASQSYQNIWQCVDEGRMGLWTQSNIMRETSLFV